MVYVISLGTRLPKSTQKQKAKKAKAVAHNFLTKMYLLF